MITYRVTRKGAWVAYGPTHEVRIGTVIVTRHDGSTKTETVERLGKTFDVKGVSHVYGYLNKRKTQPHRTDNGWCTCGACADLLGVGYQPKTRIRCPECGAWAEA